MYRRSAYNSTGVFHDENDRRSSYGRSSEGSRDPRGSFKAANLQEIFLNNCRKNEDSVCVELVHGERRVCKIIGFDSQSVILAGENTQYLVFKSAIAAITPEQPVQYIFNEIRKRDYGTEEEVSDI